MGNKIVFHWDKSIKDIVAETVYCGNEDKTLLFLANEARKLMQPYVPELNHVLVKGVNTYVEGDQGIVHYIVPYARFQFYGKLMVSSKTGSAWSHGEYKVLTSIDLKYSKSLASSHWDQAMKTAKGDELAKAVQNFIKLRGG